MLHPLDEFPVHQTPQSMSQLGTSDKNVSQMVSVFRSNYAALFPTSSTSSVELLESLQSVLSSHKDLLS